MNPSLVLLGLYCLMIYVVGMMRLIPYMKELNANKTAPMDHLVDTEFVYHPLIQTIHVVSTGVTQQDIPKPKQSQQSQHFIVKPQPQPKPQKPRLRRILT